MRHFQAVVFLLAALLSGCSWPGTRSSRGTAPGEEIHHASQSAPRGDVVYLDVALIQRPKGDAFLLRDLWSLADEQGISEESKPLLEANGLRVCQIGGFLPTGLQAMLSSPRTCPDPRRLRAFPGQPTTVLVGSQRKRVACELQLEGKPRRLDVEQAKCQFVITPTLEEDRRIRLRVTPAIRHGQSRMKPQVARDPDGQLRWSVEPEEPGEEFTALSWELTVGAGEYIVAGAISDRDHSLGRAFFVPDDGSHKQYLLVLRATPVTSGPGAEGSITRTPPLAAQAGWTAARGSSP
jgi:hypothetical protein